MWLYSPSLSISKSTPSMISLVLITLAICTPRLPGHSQLCALFHLVSAQESICFHTFFSLKLQLADAQQALSRLDADPVPEARTTCPGIKLLFSSHTDAFHIFSIL